MLGKFHCVAVSGQPTLVMSQTFDASAAEVFEAWTTAESVAQWWDPTGAPLAICEIDLRVGGVFRWINRGEIGAQHPFTGVYREISPPDRLVFDARVAPNAPQQRGTLTFEQHDGQTTLTLTIECQSVAQRDGMLAMRVEAGTARTLANLAAHLDRRAK